MSSRTGTSMIVFGVFLGFVGLCIMPAGLGIHGDKSLLGLGTALLGMGALIAAAGIYLKAVVLASKSIANAPAPVAPSPARHPRGVCDLCRNETPVVHCKVHQFHLCAHCLAQHYDFRACVYVPSTRRVETKSGRGATSKAHA